MQHPEKPEHGTESEPPIPPERSFEIREGIRYTDIQRNVLTITKDTLAGANKTFCSNNGVLEWIDEQGRIFAAPNATVEDQQALTRQGYRFAHLFVHFSNRELPLDPADRRRFRELQDSREELEAHDRKVLEGYAEKARERELKPVDGEWILMDGAIIEADASVRGDKTLRIPTNTEAIRETLVGLFLIRNGRIYFVNELGQLMMGPASKKRADILLGANYLLTIPNDSLMQQGFSFFERESPEADPDTAAMREQWKELQQKERGNARRPHEEARRLYERLQQFHGELEAAAARDDYAQFQTIKSEIEALGGTDAIREKLRAAAEEEKKFSGDFDYYIEEFVSPHDILIDVLWNAQYNEYILSFLQQSSKRRDSPADNSFTCGVFPETAQKVFRYARDTALHTNSYSELITKTSEYIRNIDDETKYGHSFDAF